MKISKETILKEVKNNKIDIGIDEQFRVDHVGCPAGTDTRRRLYIKRISSSNYVAHCFNCGWSGYAFSDIPGRISDKQGGTIPVHKSVGYDYLKDATKELPLHVEKYLLDYHVTKEEAVEKLKYRYNKPTEGLIMPFYDERNAPNYQYQVRLFGVDRVSRYVTSRRDGPIQTVCFTNGVFRPSYTVITEDQISAYRVMRDTGEDAMALLGTSINAAAIVNSKIKLNDHIIIWMDGDPAGISAANKLYKELLPLIADRKLMVVNQTQAKDLTPDELKKWMTLLSL